MEKISDNEWQVTIDFLNVGESHHYLYCRNYMHSGAEEEWEDVNSRYRTFNVFNNSVTIQDTVRKWRWWPIDGKIPAIDTTEYLKTSPANLPRFDFQCGIEFPDYWWLEHAPNIEPTLNRIVSKCNANWVQYAPVPEITSFFPSPIIDIYGSNGTPNEHMIRMITSAHERGLKVFLRPFPWNPNSTDPNPNYHGREWWIEWANQWRPILLHYAEMCTRYNVEMLFVGLSSNLIWPSQEELPVFDSLSVDLLKDVREIYDNKICLDWDGRHLNSEMMKYCDYLGIRLWALFNTSQFETFFVDIKNPSLTELEAAIELKLVEWYDNGFDPWQKPIIAVEIAASSYDGSVSGDPYFGEVGYFDIDDPNIPIDFQEQSDAYEAMLKIVSAKEWIKGAYSFNYNLWNSMDKSPSIRTKPAEKVSAKWYRWINPDIVHLSISKTDGGDVNPQPASYIFSKDTMVTVNAIPIANSDYGFEGWEGDISTEQEKENPLNLLMDSDKSIKAKFVKINNYPPQILSYSPSNDTTIYEGRTLLFNITASDSDKNPLTYTWFINDSLTQSGEKSDWKLETNYESSAIDTVSVVVSDSKFDVTHDWIVNILDRKKPKILFDEIHGELKTISWTRAKELDPQNPNWPYWGEFKNAVDSIYEIEGLYQGEFSDSTLENYNLLIMATPTIGLQNNELTILDNYIRNGGALLVLSDIFQPPINELTGKFGIIYNGFTIVDATNNEGFKKYATDFYTNHPITDGITTYHFDWGNSLTISNNAISLAWTPSTVYQDKNGNFTQDLNEQNGPFVYLAAAEYGAGRVVCMSDDAFFDFAWLNWGNDKLMMNILKWLTENPITGIKPKKNLHFNLPKDFSLLQNYPNPFNSETIIKYELPKNCDIEIIIYNSLAQEIKTLISNQQNAGYHQIKWDGLNSSGNQVSSGLYFIRMKSQAINITKKILLLR